MLFGSGNSGLRILHEHTVTRALYRLLVTFHLLSAHIISTRFIA